MATDSASDVQNDAWFIIACIINLGATYGLSFPRWEKTVCVMIEKSPGNYLLKKLRRIFIMANDYNLSGWHIWLADDYYGMPKTLEPFMKTYGAPGKTEEQMMQHCAKS